MKKIFLSLIISLFLVSAACAASETITLITREEGAIKEAPRDLYEVGRVLNDGPDIKLLEPRTNIENIAPVKVSIRFVPVEGNEIDLSKLKVEYLKFVTINLTDRVLPYTTKDGILLEKADLPAGKHTLRVTIGDIKGGVTQEVFTVKLQ
ncbi:MAG: hypothetical protein HY757_09460 [Nitrospirae bacterium]|nr:hypothetical protein [Nitrospirota bacterium]